MDATPAWHPLDGVPPPEEAPSSWDAGHVAYRLTKAFETLALMPGAMGPGSLRTAWPAALHEFYGIFNSPDEERPRATAEQISRADEALAWPLQYLADEPMRADALLVWAYCKAGGRSIAKTLRFRVAKAKQLAQVRQDAENARRAGLRREAARQAASWANARLAETTDPERIEAIKANARIRFEREAAQLMPVLVMPHEALPGKILSRASLDRYLPSALELLADRLAAAGVPCR